MKFLKWFFTEPLFLPRYPFGKPKEPTEEEKAKDKESERKAWVLGGKISRPIILISAIIYLYFSISPKISDTFASSLTSLTLGDIVGAVFSILFLIIAEIWLFGKLISGSDDEWYEIWGALGFFLLLIIGAIWYFSSR